MRRAVVVVAAVAMLGLGACTQSLNASALVVPSTPGLTAAPGDVGYHSVANVTVSGAGEGGPLSSIKFTNDEFKAAIESSLAAAGYVGTEGRPLSVTANLIEMTEPMAGIDITITTRVQYSVTRDGQVIFTDTVAASATGTMSDGFAFMDRLKIATERSVQSNIRDFIQRFRANAR